jgi:hypothetical protein
VLRPAVYLILSIDQLNAGGTVLVAEVVEDGVPEDVRGLLAVQLGDADPLPGWWVLAWRLNYANAGRFDIEKTRGVVSAATMDRIRAAVTAVITPL